MLTHTLDKLFNVCRASIAQIPPSKVFLMNSIKCRSCSLSNFPDDVECRRCGTPLFETNVSKPAKQSSPRSFSIFPWLFVAIAIGFGYYFFYGVQDNVDKVNSSEAKRLAEQKKDPTAGLSRTQIEKHRTGAYSNAMVNNPSFQAQRKHDDETQKVMQAVSNSSPR